MRVGGVRGQLREERQQRAQRVAVRRRQQLHDQPERFPLETTVVDFWKQQFLC